MASALMIVLAASGLVSAGVPATTSTPVEKAAGMVNVAPKAPAGVCMVPTAKGKVTKLSAIRKARDSRSCSLNYMQGGAGGGISGTTIASVGTAIAGGAVAGAVGGAVGGSIADNNNTPNP